MCAVGWSGGQLGKGEYVKFCIENFFFQQLFFIWIKIFNFLID